VKDCKAFLAILYLIKYNWIYMKYPIDDRMDARLSRLPDSVNRRLSRIDELKGQWVGGAQLSPQLLGRLKHSVLVTSTGASTRIEGAKLSDAEIEKLIRGLSVMKLPDRDSQEVKGYHDLLQAVFDEFNNMPFSENIILELHARLLKYSDKDVRHRGTYKALENNVEMRDADRKLLSVLFETSPAYMTPKHMQELVTWTNDAFANDTYHPLLVTASFIVEFLKIHPFLDGNGRLSRVLTNLLLLQHGFIYIPYVSLEKLIEDNKTEYYIALRSSQATFGTERETIEPWVNFLLNACTMQAEQAIALLSGENLGRTLSSNQLLVWQYVRSVDEATIRGATETTGVARPTVKQAFDRLLKLKLVERVGLGRSTRYRRL
jgi:Fic family protein